MPYFRVDLIDNGYADANGNAIMSIDGLNNRDAERFHHLGYVYPVQSWAWEMPGQYVVVQADSCPDGATSMPEGWIIPDTELIQVP